MELKQVKGITERGLQMRDESKLFQVSGRWREQVEGVLGFEGKSLE